MYCRVIACDFDGTGATNGRPAPELYAALSAARAEGITTLLVTGRLLEDVQMACEEFSPFDAVVAENGAVVDLCSLGRTIQLGNPPPDRFLGALRSQGVPFHTGNVIVGTWEQHTHKVLEVIRRFGLDAQLIFNRAALMVLPSGINKSVGIRHALDELGRSERNLIAFGDAENDIPMFLDAEMGIAARHSVPAIAALADDSVSQPGGAGVALYIRKLLEAGGIVRTPPRRILTLGKAANGSSVTVPASGANLVISGDPRSGKSWIAGLISEQLIEQGYRICIIDPEGDHAQMGQRSRVITFGHDLALPSPQALSRLLETEPLSTVLTLPSLSAAEQLDYARRVLATLQERRRVAGIPHWVFVDEAHYFFRPGSPCLEYLKNDTGNFCLITYRPSLLANEAYDTIGAQIITHTRVEEERYYMTQILQAHGRGDISAHAALDGIEWPAAGLLTINAPGNPWQVFAPAERITRHTHHARKYADTRLSDDKAFRFMEAGSPITVHNMIEFYQAIQNVPMASLRHHLIAGDFSRWVGDILGDQQLAKGLRKLERTMPVGVTPDRAEILAHIKDQYLIEES